MPHFDPYYADKLRGARGLQDADSVLDLTGMTAPQAQAAIQEILDRSRFARRGSVAIRLAPPPEGGGETLFQPVGRQLLEARKAGVIEHLQTLPGGDGLGFFVELAGRVEAG